MASDRLSLRIESELKIWLEQEGRRKDRSAGYIATQAIAQFKENTEAIRTLLEAGMKQADEGIFVSEKAVTDWFLSVGTENELPMPKPDVFLKPAKT